MNIATFVDVVDAYSKPCRLVFYLTLEIVNINLARSFCSPRSGRRRVSDQICRRTDKSRHRDFMFP